MPFEPKIDVDEDCLICCEPLNHDLNFYPCPREFQVSLWSFVWMGLELEIAVNQARKLSGSQTTETSNH